MRQSGDLWEDEYAMSVKRFADAIEAAALASPASRDTKSESASSGLVDDASPASTPEPSEDGRELKQLRGELEFWDTVAAVRASQTFPVASPASTEGAAPEKRRGLARAMLEVVELPFGHWNPEKVRCLLEHAAALVDPDSTAEPIAWAVFKTLAVEGEQEELAGTTRSEEAARRYLPRLEAEGAYARIRPLYDHAPAAPPEGEREWRIAPPDRDVDREWGTHWDSPEEADRRRRHWQDEYKMQSRVRAGPWSDAEEGDGADG